MDEGWGLRCVRALIKKGSDRSCIRQESKVQNMYRRCLVVLCMPVINDSIIQGHWQTLDPGCSRGCTRESMPHDSPPPRALLPYLLPGSRELGMSVLLSALFTWLLHFTLVVPYMTQVRVQGRGGCREVRRHAG